MLTADDKVVFIGKAQDLAQRWGRVSTGRSSPRTVTRPPVDELQDPRCGSEVDEGQPAALICSFSTPRTATPSKPGPSRNFARRGTAADSSDRI